MASSTNHQSDKALSKSAASWLGFWGLVVVLGIWALSHSESKLNAQRSHAKAESLAYQVLELRRQTTRTESRGPASVPTLAGEGIVGENDSGKPYQYKVFEQDSTWVVRVWNQDRPQDPTEVRIRKEQL